MKKLSFSLPVRTEIASLEEGIHLIEQMAHLAGANFTEIGQAVFTHPNNKPYMVTKEELRDYLRFVGYKSAEKLNRDISALYDSGKKPLTHVPFKDAFELIKKYAHHH